jgi:isopropylmalate/homocitrate/citramalate synthase
MIGFVDTTLRDGERAPGVVFTVREKIQIAKLLDRLGVYQIGAGVQSSASGPMPGPDGMRRASH